MAENHELRLKIDAAAAQRGSREFVAAVRAVKEAVRGLERDSTGAFTKLSKNIKDAERASKLKISGVDKRTIANIESYASKLRQTIKDIAQTRKSTHTLRDAVERMSGAFGGGTEALNAYRAGLSLTNLRLRQTIKLAKETREALGSIPQRPMVQAVAAKPVKATTATTTAPVAKPIPGGRGEETARELERQEAMRNRITRAIDNQRAATVALQASLSKVGGTSHVEKLERAFLKFQNSLSGAKVSSKELDDATTALNHAQKSSKVALTRYNAQVADQRKSLEAAASAAREQAKAFRELTNATNANARANATAAQEARRQEAALMSGQKAVHTANIQAIKLTETLRGLGQPKAQIDTVNNALKTLRAELGQGAKSQHEVRVAVAAYEKALHPVQRALTKLTAESTANAAATRRASSGWREIERDMRSAAGAANATARSLHNVTSGMRGLENAFNGTYQIGSLFRQMLGTLTLGTFITSVYQAGAALEQFMVTMEVATGSMAGAAEQADFIDGLASRFGTSLRVAREDFSKFSVASSLAGVEMAETQKIFESVSMALSVMGRGAEDQRLAFLALEQMMSKGTISSEELRRQLGERLPGAVNLMAKAVGVTTGELQDMLKAGELASADVLPKFADEVNKAFGPGLEAATKRASRNMGTFKNEIEKLLSTVAQSGFMDVLAAEFNRLTHLMRSDDVKNFARELGSNLADLAKMGSTALQWMVENFDALRKAITAVGIGVLVSKMTGFIGFAATATQQIAAMVGGFMSWRAARAATTVTEIAATAATDRNTDAERRNQAAKLAGNSAIMAKVKALGVEGAAYDRASAAAMRHERAANAANKASSFAGIAGGASRLLGVLGGIGMAASIAFGAYQLFFADAAEETARFEKDIEGALRRTGAYFENFGEQVKGATQRDLINDIIGDFGILATGLSDIVQKTDGEFEKLRKLTDSANGISVDFGGWFGGGKKDFLEEMGFSVNEIDRFTAAQQRLAAGFVDSFEQVRAGTKSAQAFNNELKNALALNPGMSKLIDQWAELNKIFVMREVGQANAGDELAGILNPETGKALLNLRDLGLKAHESKDAMKAFTDEALRMGKEIPGTAAIVKKLKEEIAKPIEDGADPKERADRLMAIIEPRIGELAQLQEVQEKAEQAFIEATQNFDNTVESKLQDALNLVGDGFNITQYNGIQELADNFALLQQNASVSMAMVNEALQSLNPPTEKMAEMKDEVLAQFAALEEGQQTYANFNKILYDTAQSSEYASKHTEEFANTLADLVRGQSDASLTTADLRAELMELDLPVSVIELLVDAIVDAGGELINTSNDAAVAGQAVTNFGNDASGASGQVDALTASLGRFQSLLRGMGNVLPSAKDFTNVVNDLQVEADIAKLSGLDRAIAEVTKGGKGAAGKLLEEGRQGIAEINDKLAQGNLHYEHRAHLESELNKLKGEQATREEKITGLIEQRYKNQEEADKRERARRKAERQSESGGKKKKKSKEDLTRDQEAIKALTDARAKHVESLEKETLALSLLVQGQVTSMEHAEMLAEATYHGAAADVEATRAMIERAQAAEKLNKKLEILARDPVQEWMDSVPSWMEAGQIIEKDAIGSISDALSEMMTTGKMDMEELGMSILGTINDVIAEKAVKDFLNLIGLGGDGRMGGEKAGLDLGGILNGWFGGDEMAVDTNAIAGLDQAGALGGAADISASITQAMSMGANQVSQAILSAFGQVSGQLSSAGAQMGTQVSSAGITAGTMMGTNVQQAGSMGAMDMQRGIVSGSQQGAMMMQTAVSSGGGGGGLLGGMGGGGWASIGLSVGMMALGSILNKKSKPKEPAEKIEWEMAPHYAQGTANTSGHPAILHDNEAVIPLTGNRKVPVELEDGKGGGRGTVIHQTFNIQTQDADSFRKSQKQIAADMAGAGQAAMRDNR